jgi:aspartyl-tRNA synthetase
MSKRILAKQTVELIGQEVKLMGWANSRRDHGGVIFIDLRDESGLVQVTVHPDSKEAFKLAEGVRDEYVLKVIGRVIEREKNLINPNLETGTVEVVVETLEILNKSEPLPFAVSVGPENKEEQNVGEDVRLKYRYLDLRRPKMQHMLKRRAEMYAFIRKYMEANDFTEVATPILANSSPEGARDFLIPSRFNPGKFFALPQAPQQFKQLLMVGGVPRYYQFATCFRDEDTRADRLYGDFYQLDLEMAFVDDGEEVREMIDPLALSLTTEFAGKRLTFKDIPRITHAEAADRFGSDRPDLRFGMELVNLSEDFANTEFGVFGGALKNGGVVKAINVKGGASLSRSEIDKFTDTAKLNGAGGLAYINFVDGEVKSPIAKFLSESEVSSIKEKLEVEDGDAVFFGADSKRIANRVLGVLRSEFADHFKLKDPNEVAWCWVVDFPFYEWDEKRNKLDFGHNPFSMPKGGLKALEDAKTDEQRLEIVADQYDLVVNGYEASSGAVRNYNPEIMFKVFDILGYDSKYVEAKFGAMLDAFKFGAPPHAGTAPGMDRIFMVLMGEDNIREVVAFPKNGSGVDLMMNSPSVVEDAQLEELSLKIVES